MVIISSYDLCAGHLYNSVSFPTSSCESFLGAARCFLVTESAAGCILSFLRSEMVTREIGTGFVMPASGRISTVPSRRGYRLVSNVQDGRRFAEHTNVAEMPGYPTKKFVLGRPATRTKAFIFV